jgi:DNA-binding CsgD family transcriptional regulator
MGFIQIDQINNKHATAILAPEVDEICKPLKEYGIIHFIYSRFLSDGTGYALTNHWPSFEHHCKHSYDISPPMHNITKNDFSYFPFINHESTGFNSALYDWRHIFNIDQPLYFVEKREKYTDFYCYSTTFKNYNIINFYLNNMELLERFKFYFQEQAAKLIPMVMRNRLLIPTNMPAAFHTNRIDSYNSFDAAYVRKLAGNSYSFNCNNNIICINKREIDVLLQLAQGCSMKEVALVLHLSPRTVETYIQNIKIKSGLRKRSDLIKLVTSTMLRYK